MVVSGGGSSERVDVVSGRYPSGAGRKTGFARACAPHAPEHANINSLRDGRLYSSHKWIGVSQLCACACMCASVYVLDGCAVSIYSRWSTGSTQHFRTGICIFHFMSVPYFANSTYCWPTEHTRSSFVRRMSLVFSVPLAESTIPRKAEQRQTRTCTNKLTHINYL